MDEIEARERLERMVSVSSEPVLDSATITALLDAARRIDPYGNAPTNIAGVPTWTPATVYTIGDVVTADPAAGRWWRAVTSGTSAATQPSWPDLGTSPGPYGARVNDGPVLLWEDAGTHWSPTWDLAAAAAEGWELKAGLVAHRFTFTTDGQMFQVGQLIDHCESRAKHYRRQVVGNAAAH